MIYGSFPYGEILKWKNQHFIFGDHGEGEIPDPIPNSEVKTFIADGTIRKSMEE